MRYPKVALKPRFTVEMKEVRWYIILCSILVLGCGLFEFPEKDVSLSHSNLLFWSRYAWNHSIIGTSVVDDIVRL